VGDLIEIGVRRTVLVPTLFALERACRTVALRRMLSALGR